MAHVIESALARCETRLREQPLRWLLTGSAGFIGSHLLERLLMLGQEVVSVDNFATGAESNLDAVHEKVGTPAWRRHRFMEGDLRDARFCRLAVGGAQVVLHQAALGSVPRSMEFPGQTHEANVNGFVNLLIAAREAGVSRFVYASSSSVYGDDDSLPKREDITGSPLSPYALSKSIGEAYAQLFARCYGMTPIGLRYFNVFGPRQDPEGPYAAVIPRWIAALTRGEAVTIHGDGSNSRDFCYVANVVQANLLAAYVERPPALHRVYNVALGQRTSLLELLEMMRKCVATQDSRREPVKATFAARRPGDVAHSVADIERAVQELGYSPTHGLQAGLAETVAWHRSVRSDRVAIS